MAGGGSVRITIVAGLLGLVAAAGLVGLGRRTPASAPDFAVTDLRGQAVRLSALRGKVVLVNLWTTWCAPCRQEMPSLERLYRRLAGRGFQVLAVSQDEEGSRAVEPFVRELNLTFPVLIDRNGRVVEHVIGPRDWMAPEWLARLDALIAAPEVDAAGVPAPPGRS